MKNVLGGVIIAMAFAGSAYAAQTNAGCQGNCPSGGDTTNAGGIGYGGQGGNASSIGVGVGVGIGGSGGSGGAGGSGGSGGAGGAVVGSGNSSANSAVVGSGNSRNDLSQDQKQSQQANSNQSQSSHNDNASSASNRNSNAAQGNTTNVSGDTVTYEAARIPVATAYAAGLTASNGTCMGSTSAGGQGMSFGFSVGTTWKDSGCDRRYNAQALAAVGQAKAAVALLCQDPDIKAAMETAGTPCSATAEAKAASRKQAVEAETIAKAEPIDSLIRARLGLPPLK